MVKQYVIINSLGLYYCGWEFDKNGKIALYSSELTKALFFDGEEPAYRFMNKYKKLFVNKTTPTQTEFFELRCIVGVWE